MRRVPVRAAQHSGIADLRFAISARPLPGDVSRGARYRKCYLESIWSGAAGIELLTPAVDGGDVFIGSPNWFR